MVARGTFFFHNSRFHQQFEAMATTEWTDADESAFQEMLNRRKAKQQLLLPVAHSATGAMTDASKRRATELKVFENFDSEWDSGPFCGGSPTAPSPAVVEFLEAPELPDGVQTMEEWGRTQFAFGKYYKQVMSYAKAYKEDSAYVAWSRNHLIEPKSAGASLDWGKYVRARDMVEKRLEKGPFYSGTTIRREFVKWKGILPNIPIDELLGW